MIWCIYSMLKDESEYVHHWFDSHCFQCTWWLILSLSRRQKALNTFCLLISINKSLFGFIDLRVALTEDIQPGWNTTSFNKYVVDIHCLKAILQKWNTQKSVHLHSNAQSIMLFLISLPTFQTCVSSSIPLRGTLSMCFWLGSTHILRVNLIDTNCIKACMCVCPPDNQHWLVYIPVI